MLCRVREENAQLRAENDALRAEKTQLRAKNDALRAEKTELERSIIALARRLG